ncbi:MAG: hypothetical protein AAB739_04330 [Patescibacteria group bacterium]
MEQDRSEARRIYKEAVATGLAMGVLKADGLIVANDDGITGEEAMAKGGLRREIGELALTTHDGLIRDGELNPSESVRSHILRIISEAT